MGIIYQLSATGKSLNGYEFKMKSKKVFIFKASAEAYVPQFIDSCTDETYFEAAYRDSVKVKIIELEFIEE